MANVSRIRSASSTWRRAGGMIRTLCRDWRTRAEGPGPLQFAAEIRPEFALSKGVVKREEGGGEYRFALRYSLLTGKKKERPHSFRCHGRPTHGPAGVGACAAVLLSPCHRLADRRSGGRREAPVLIPRPDGRPTWFVHASAASRIGSRTDPSHCAPRRYVGAGGARDWLHLFGPGDHQVQRCPERASAPIISPAE